MLKPDAFERQLDENILKEFKEDGVEIVRSKKIIVDKKTILDYYHHVLKRINNPHFKNYILEAFEGKMIKVFEVQKYGKDSLAKARIEKRILKNLVHASDSKEAYEKEVKLWFNVT